MSIAEEEAEEDVRDDICGEVTRAAIAAVGGNCGGKTVGEVADDINTIRGLSASATETADEDPADRDRIRVTITDSVASGQLFLILQRNGFTPERMDWPTDHALEEGEIGPRMWWAR